MTVELRIRPLAESDVEDVAAASRADRGSLLAEVTSWQVQKSPTVVARSLDGAFVGFARALPVEFEETPRPDGQVVELAGLYVVPSFRGQGAGTAVLARLLKTLRMLGYARVVAHANEPVAAWLGARDWEVLPAGRALAWVEPFIPRDDLWKPEIRSGSFSPVLRVAPTASRPLEAWATLADRPPILAAQYPTTGPIEANADRAVADHLAANRHLAELLPPRLREILEDQA